MGAKHHAQKTLSVQHDSHLGDLAVWGPNGGHTCIVLPLSTGCYRVVEHLRVLQQTPQDRNHDDEEGEQHDEDSIMGQPYFAEVLTSHPCAAAFAWRSWAPRPKSPDVEFLLCGSY
eukprot:4079502-Amphidinium_carterae.1